MLQLKHPYDPRADLVTDHKHWKDVLWNVWHEDEDRGLYGVLHGLRCGGAELVLTAKSFMLLPGEWKAEEWEDTKKKYLVPHKDQLISLFKMTRFCLHTNEPLPEGIFDKEVQK